MNIQTTSNYLKILKDINLAVSRNLNIIDSSKATLSILQESWGIISGAVFISDNEGKTLTMTASVGYKKNVTKTKYKIGEGLTGRIAETCMKCHTRIEEAHKKVIKGDQ